MSGTACLIIIRGNRAQGNTRAALAGPLSTSAALTAQQLIGGFQSLCNLGTSTYDGAEIMSDEQQESASALMGAYNDAVEPLLLAAGQATARAVADLIVATHGRVYALLAEVAGSQCPAWLHQPSDVW